MSEQNLTPPEQSILAVISLVAGIAGWTLVPFFGALLAVVTGHMARRQIQESGGQLDGERSANAGLALGYGCLAFTLLLFCALLSTLLFGFGLLEPLRGALFGGQPGCSVCSQLLLI